MILRIIFNLLILLQILINPSWLLLLFISLGFILYDNFYEAFFWLILTDYIFAAPRELFFNFQYIYTFLSVLLFFSIDFLKTRIYYAL